MSRYRFSTFCLICGIFYAVASVGILSRCVGSRVLESVETSVAQLVVSVIIKVSMGRKTKRAGC